MHEVMLITLNLYDVALFDPKFLIQLVSFFGRPTFHRLRRA